MTVLDLKNKIILELLTKNLISIGEAIDYKKFEFLYSFYNYLPEFYFAKILDINYTNYNSGLKYQKIKVTILKNFDISLIKDEILSYLLNNNIVSYNMEISYREFIKILELFPFLNEESLAEILGLKISRIQNLKFKQSAKAIILKRSFNLSKSEEDIIDDLINLNLIFPGQQINYDFLKKLHTRYPEIKENRFAYILEITPSTYSRMKKGKNSPKILKSRAQSYINQQKQFIINDIITNKNAYANEKINYIRFCELYQGYEYIGEEVFANLILGIKYNNFISLKFENTNAIILNKAIRLTDKQSQEIYYNTLKTYNLKEGCLINYETFLSIYQTYSGYITERDFAEILGINENRFDALKFKKKNIRIVNGITLQKMYFLAHKFSEARFYSKEELTNIIKEYNLSYEDIIIYIINKRRYFIVEDYIESLNTNHGLFIGKTQMSKAFFKENYNTLLRYTKLNIYRLRNNLPQNYISYSDLAQEILLYIFNNCGDLEKNFGNTDKFFHKMSSRVQKYTFGKLKNEENKNEFLYIDMQKNLPIDKCNILSDNNVNVEGEAILLADKNNDFYSKTLYLLAQGYSFEESLEYLSRTFNIAKVKVYNTLKNKCELILQLKRQSN